jgi:hypothetical protein
MRAIALICFALLGADDATITEVEVLEDTSSGGTIPVQDAIVRLRRTSPEPAQTTAVRLKLDPNQRGVYYTDKIPPGTDEVEIFIQKPSRDPRIATTPVRFHPRKPVHYFKRISKTLPMNTVASATPDSPPSAYVCAWEQVWERIVFYYRDPFTCESVPFLAKQCRCRQVLKLVDAPIEGDEPRFGSRPPLDRQSVSHNHGARAESVVADSAARSPVPESGGQQLSARFSVDGIPERLRSTRITEASMAAPRYSLPVASSTTDR